MTGLTIVTDSKAEAVVKVYKFNKESGEFDLVDPATIPGGGIKDLLAGDQAASFAVFQLDKYMVWLYHGEETTTQVKFMSARAIQRLRDEVLLGGKISTVDQGSEPLPFQFVTGMAKPEDFGVTDGPAEYTPAYTGSREDETSLERLSLERVALLLEQLSTPDGHEREAIVHDNTFYALKNSRRRFMGSEIEQIELVPLPKGASIETGTYLAADLVPRLYFENNRLVLVELLRKTGERRAQETLFDKLR